MKKNFGNVGGGNSKTSFFKVEGLKELNNTLEQLPKAWQKRVLNQVLLKAGAQIQEAAIANVPVRTGKLKNAIINTTKADSKSFKKAYAEIMKSGGTKAQAAAGARAAQRGKKETFAQSFVGVAKRGSGTAYAVPLEFGTYKMNAQPFMRPAWEARKQDALAVITSEMKETLDAAVVKYAAKQARKAARLARK